MAHLNMMTVMAVIAAIMLALQVLLPKKGDLAPIPQVMLQMHQEEVMLGQFILDSALAISVAVENLKKPQNFGIWILFAWRHCRVYSTIKYKTISEKYYRIVLSVLSYWLQMMK